MTSNCAQAIIFFASVELPELQNFFKCLGLIAASNIVFYFIYQIQYLFTIESRRRRATWQLVNVMCGKDRWGSSAVSCDKLDRSSADLGRRSELLC